MTLQTKDGASPAACCVPVIVTLLALCECLGIGGCREKQDVPDIVTAMAQRTVPASATGGTSPTVRRDELGIASSWEFDVTTDSSVYRAWLRQQLLPDFKIVEDQGRHCSFAKMTSGDSFSLAADEVGPGPGVRIRITFQARAD